jgi:hypothetical protein
MISVLAVSGCAGTGSREPSDQSLIGKRAILADRYDQPTTVSTLARLVTSSGGTFRSMPSDGASWTIVVSCSTSGRLGKGGGTLSLGVVPSRSMTPEILARARKHDFDHLVAGC